MEAEIKVKENNVTFEYRLQMDDGAAGRKALAEALDDCRKRFPANTERVTGSRSDVVRRGNVVATDAKKEVGDAK